MTNMPMSPTGSCVPCISEKERKKQVEQEVKQIKDTINYLALRYSYDPVVQEVLGKLVNKLVILKGELK